MKQLVHETVNPTHQAQHFQQQQPVQQLNYEILALEILSTDNHSISNAKKNISGVIDISVFITKISEPSFLILGGPLEPAYRIDDERQVNRVAISNSHVDKAT